MFNRDGAEFFFDFEIFVTKYGSKHSESIPTKKYNQKLLTLPYFNLWPKNDSF